MAVRADAGRRRRTGWPQRAPDISVSRAAQPWSR